METDLLIPELVEELDSALIKSQLKDHLQRVATLFTDSIPEQQAVDIIYAFLKVYIKITPEFIRTLTEIGARYRIESLIDPCIRLATSYLSSACTSLVQDEADDSLRKFLTLLQGAYISHRLMEELDDRIRRFIGVPLSHFDMMAANLIAHEIIGDKFANRLDQITTSMFQQSKITKALIEAQLERDVIEQYQASGRALSGEPVTCLAGQHDLSMLKSERTP